MPAPTQVGILIERRLTKLSPEALKLARLAAIAGPDFSVEIAASILRRHILDIADTWHELEAAQVIRDQAFAHDLIYEATLKSIPAAIARSLHGEVAKLLETRKRRVRVLHDIGSRLRCGHARGRVRRGSA